MIRQGARRAVGGLDLALLASLMLAACGGRPLPVDGGPLPDGQRPSSDRRHDTPDLPAGDGCRAPGDCNLGSDFCNLDGKCAAAGAIGQCQPRPSACPAILKPVCGCDGKTYGNDCDAHSSGVSVASRGKCCKELEAEYLELLQLAKKCCAVCAIGNECTQVVDNRLTCPCPTAVNAQAPELAQLQVLRQQWTDQACGKSVACPPMPCTPVSDAGCQGVIGSTGMCIP